MSTYKIEPHKITHPIQLLAVWLVGQICVVSAFLTAAAKLTTPPWLPVVLVICAAVLAVVFSVSIFLSLTKFRKQILSDPRYVRLEEMIHVIDEYTERFEQQQKRNVEIVPQNRFLFETSFGRTRFEVLNDNIVHSKAHVLVSSDDNYLQAGGGVARVILDAAGTSVADELALRRRHIMHQGNIAITSGGRLQQCRAIFHPAVIDLDENRYSDGKVIMGVVRWAIRCAIAMGARSIAFPVLGGGGGDCLEIPQPFS